MRGVATVKMIGRAHPLVDLVSRNVFCRSCLGGITDDVSIMRYRVPRSTDLCSLSCVEMKKQWTS
jgi:hypothetical protein